MPICVIFRSNELWACRTTALNASGTTDEPQTNSTVRGGVEWFHLAINPATKIATIQETGRIYDGNATNYRWYYYPSLMVNAHGDVVMGFSGSSLNDSIGAFYTGRRGGQSSFVTPPMTLQSGSGTWPSDRWGDYSHTTLDPNDSLSIWTIQEYVVVGPFSKLRIGLISGY